MNPFETLNLPRRPLLTEEEIGIAYRRLAGETHPDQVGGDENRFKELGVAAAVLRDPARRLRELSNTQSPQSAHIPPRAEALFPIIAELLQRSDTLQNKLQTASNPLAKAVLKAPFKSLLGDLQATLVQLTLWREELDSELCQANELWPSHDPAALAQLADSFAYVGRWQNQLRDRELALGTFLD